MSNFKKTLATCKEFNLNPELTAEQCWNEGYRLGRKRWYWGPAWFITLIGWWNTKRIIHWLKSNEHAAPPQ